MKRHHQNQGEGEKKRFRDEPGDLVRLDPSSVETFIAALRKKAGKTWTSAACAFDGYIPSAMLDYGGTEATRVIAFAADRLPIGNDTNEDPITIAEYQEIKIAEIMANHPEMTRAEAKKKAFPKVNQKITQSEVLQYLQHVQQTIAFAEMSMANDVNILLNNDPRYRAVKQDRCMIGWLKILRHKAMNSSSSIELAKRNIDKQLEILEMENSAEGYYTYREKFKALVSSLRDLPGYQLDEQHLLTIFVVKLHRTKFPNMVYEFTAGRYRDVTTLKQAYQILNDIQDRTVLVGNQYTQLYSNKSGKKSKQQQELTQPKEESERIVNFNKTTSTKAEKPKNTRENQERERDNDKDNNNITNRRSNSNSNSNSNNNNNSNNTERVAKICRFYKPGVDNSCTNAICKFVHVADNSIWRELNDLDNKRKEILQKARKES